MVFSLSPRAHTAQIHLTVCHPSSCPSDLKDNALSIPNARGQWCCSRTADLTLHNVFALFHNHLVLLTHVPQSFLPHRPLFQSMKLITLPSWTTVLPTRLPNKRKKDFSPAFSQTLLGIRFTSAQSWCVSGWGSSSLTFQLADELVVM